jgi:hypothetical protein
MRRNSSSPRKAPGRHRAVMLKPVDNKLPIGHPGRPPKYDPALCPRARKLALLGMTEVEIAEQFSIHPDTLLAWKSDHPAFAEALDEGRVKADAEVADSLFNRATGRVKIPAVKIFMPPGATEPVYAPYVEHFPPDAQAGRLWLMNRQPGKWRERREVDLTMTLEHRLAQMTPQERRASFLELQARAAIFIEGESVGAEDEGNR